MTFEPLPWWFWLFHWASALPDWVTNAALALFLLACAALALFLRRRRTKARGFEVE